MKIKKWDEMSFDEQTAILDNCSDTNSAAGQPWLRIRGTIQDRIKDYWEELTGGEETIG